MYIGWEQNAVRRLNSLSLSLCLDVPRVVSIFSGLQLRLGSLRSRPPQKRRARLRRAGGLRERRRKRERKRERVGRKTATSCFSAALPRNSVLMRPEFCSRSRAAATTRHLILRMHRRRRHGASGAWEKPGGARFRERFNYAAACEGSRVIEVTSDFK